MRPLHEQDFDKMAARVVDGFMGGAKLADVATHEAMQGQLNPDQIERMVQAANTQAFLRLMEQQKTQAGASGPDMTHEFDPIDARQIIQQIVGQVDVPHMDQHQPQQMPGPDMEAPLPDEHAMPPGMPHGAPQGMPPGMGEAPPEEAPSDEAPPIDDNDGPFPKSKKDKAKDKDKDDAKPKKKPPEAKKDEAKEAAFRSRRQQKLAGVMADQYKQAEWVFEDTFAELTTMLKRAHGAPTMDAFEKDALSLYNDEYGLTVLNMVRDTRGLEPISADAANAKHAALADRHLAEDNDAIKVFGRLVKIATEAADLARGVEYLRTQCV